MNISDEAVEAARSAYWSYPMKRAINNSDEAFRAALEAAAPHLIADVERELADAERMVALLILNAGGRVTITERDMISFDPATILERVENPATGEWVITATSAGAGK